MSDTTDLRDECARLTKSQIKVLIAIYTATDCCNEVYDYAALHWTQERIADAMPELVTAIDGVVNVDGDGFIKNPGRYGRGFRLTQAGYEALTKYDGARFPPGYRRFAAAAIERARGGTNV